MISEGLKQLIVNLDIIIFMLLIIYLVFWSNNELKKIQK